LKEIDDWTDAACRHDTANAKALNTIFTALGLEEIDFNV
jgi:hypothetical protein